VPKDAGGGEDVSVVDSAQRRNQFGAVWRGQLQKTLGRQPFLRRRIYFCLSGCARTVHERGTFIEMTPHKDVKKSAKDVDESTMRTPRLIGW